MPVTLWVVPLFLTILGIMMSPLYPLSPASLLMIIVAFPLVTISYLIPLMVTSSAKADKQNINSCVVAGALFFS